MNPPNPPRIVIEVRNGQVVGVYSNDRTTKVKVIDRDIQNKEFTPLLSALYTAIENDIQVLYKVL